MNDTPDRTPDDADEDEELRQKQETLDRLRGTGVGVEDPNIVGDADPTDVPPGRDPDPGAPGT